MPQTLSTRIMEIDEPKGGNASAPLCSICAFFQNGNMTILRAPGYETVLNTVPMVYDPLWVGIDHVPVVANITVSWAGLPGGLSVPGCPLAPVIATNCSDLQCYYYCNTDMPTESTTAVVRSFYHGNLSMAAGTEAPGIRTYPTVLSQGDTVSRSPGHAMRVTWE